MPDPNDDALAAAAVDLNANAKAKRGKGKAGEATVGVEGETQLEGGDPLLPDEGGSDGFDAGAEHASAVDRMEMIADELELTSKALVFDVRDFLLDTIKSRPKPWSATSQAEQRDVAAACEHAGRELVRKIVEAVAAHGVDPVRVLLTKINIGDDIVITGKVKTYSDEEADKAVGILHHARGKHVMVTVASVDDYAGEGREADTEADEPGFGFEGDDD